MASPSRRSNQERREQSTEQVLASALKLFVTRGYGSTSIDDIARDAGLTKGAVYFYFKGKSALLVELLTQSTALYDEIFVRMQSSDCSAPDQLEMFVEWAAGVGVRNNELLLVILLPEYRDIRVKHMKQSADNRSYTTEMPRPFYPFKLFREMRHNNP